MAAAPEMPTCYRHPDRPTGLSCSECGRPICTDCMTVAPVGLRCPDHSGRPQGAQRIVRTAQRTAHEGRRGIVTRFLVALNVAIYVAELAQGSGAQANQGSIYANGALIASGREIQGHLVSEQFPLGQLVGVAHGDWWRLITSAFLHYGPIHLGINMLVLWIYGAALEMRLGAGRFLLLYLVSGLAGAAGALLVNPLSPTVGASGAIFGIFGAGLVLERQRDFVFGGGAFALIALNLAFSFTPGLNISWGGHVGGLIGGIIGTLGLSRFGRGHAAYGRLGAVGVVTLVAVGAASVAVAYWKAKGYA
jgi:membrane associated rhomboid family serine protease